jgi:hypothetical protein
LRLGQVFELRERSRLRLQPIANPNGDPHETVPRKMARFLLLTLARETLETKEPARLRTLKRLKPTLQ